MEDPLPASVDLVVVGTGLGEAMLAAAAARSGCSVLHLDDANYYGGEWASFNLRTIDEWAEREKRRERGEMPPEPVASLIKEGETLQRIYRRPTIRNFKDEWTEASAAPTTAAVEATADDAASEDAALAPPTWREAVDEHWRRFSIDISPKVLLSRGDLVRTLCDSEVSAYAEFKLVDRLLGVTVKEGAEPIDIHRIPCSRGDIFDSEALSMLDKRRLMKLLQLCMQWHAAPEKCDVIREAARTPFFDFLATQNIQGSLANLLTRSLSFLSPAGECPTTEASIEGLCRFMDSVGVFGASPFLVPLYGSGELPQCFARLCAVFGGVYCLGRAVEGIVQREDRVVAVLVAGQRVECGHLLLTSAFAPEQWMKEDPSSTVSRAVLFSHGSVKEEEEEKESISLLNLGGLAPAAGARLLEVGFEACTAPRGYYVAHVTTSGASSGLVDDVIEKMYEKSEDKNDDGEKSTKPRLLRRMEWSQTGYSAVGDRVPENVGVLRLPDATADYRNVMEEAKSLFARFWPDRDFLPRALKKAQEDGEPFDARDEQEIASEEVKEKEENGETTVSE
ncbi:hypothetical protein PMAYCL1PPCAC_10088 [Pristionchus mayeri]|uniref:Rab proteins geranylgeranyltransferase component A n=1 Tax=Pristionchus mayeri TaxID=1317129 RepID=A0AAN4ZES0_9BILA|nr:hypothetical protein PMAYCL1PPCAC_10088 [Pristionchus mayeri]